VDLGAELLVLLMLMLVRAVLVVGQ